MKLTVSTSTAIYQKNQQLTDDPVTRLKNTGIAYVEFAIISFFHVLTTIEPTG